MNCQEFQLFVDAYVDGEFSDRERAEIEVHLQDCAECRAEVDAKIRYKEQLKEVLGQPKAPESLRLRIVEEIDEAERQAKRDRRREPIKRFALVGAPLAASVALVIWFLPQITTVTPASSEQVPMVENTVEWHSGDFPIEVTGPQPREVARWFRGKVDFPVRLPTFKSKSVRLIGGRIAHVNNRRAAYALYDVDGARLSVMIFHGDDLKVPGDKVRHVSGRDVAVLNSRGYEVAVLQDDGITYTMTSDLPEEEMLELVGTSLQR